VRAAARARSCSRLAGLEVGWIVLLPWDWPVLGADGAALGIGDAGHLGGELGGVATAQQPET
jgi:hypothetical protein